MKLFRSSSRFFVFAYIICINHAFSISESDSSYANHCSSVIPPYNITTRINGSSLPSLSTSLFTGGNWFERVEPGGIHNHAGKDLKLRLRPDHYRTTAAGVYSVEGFLYITFTYRDYDVPEDPETGDFRFPMKGFWSEESRKLCMVGSTSLKAIDVGAVLKFKFDDDENPTIYTAVVSGSLESTAPATDPAFFDSILIFDFPQAPNYNYSLVSEEIGGVFPSRKADSLSLESNAFCQVMQQGLLRLELEYATECAERRSPHPHRCSPLQFLPNYLMLTSIQCEEGAKQARFLAIFQNYSDYENFPPGSTMIGEAWWDNKSNRINGVACGILDPSLQLGNSVGDCTMRLSLNHPSVLTLRNDANIEGEIWSSKAAEDPGYFRRINLTSRDEGYYASLRPDQRYKYTELDRARRSCSHHHQKKKKGMSEYPNGQSHDMGFYTDIKNSDGRSLAWGTATPVWVENDLFKPRKDTESAAIPVLLKLDPAQKRDFTKMSYKLMLSLFSSYDSSSPSLDWPLVYPSRELLITAEGLYYAETGHLCMVGCRKLMLQNSTSAFKDCEIVLELELPVLSGERGRLVKGVIRSTRPRTDPLHFDDLMMDPAAHDEGEAEQSIWRVDFEITMVLVSNTLVCIFVALQIFHVKKNPEVASFVSLVMLVILCAGHTIPLVLSLAEAGNGGRLEANEVAVRIITMATLLLQLRLLQLVYAALKQRENSWSEEKMAGFVSITLYVLGGLLTLVLRKTYGVWGDLRSYAGLVLDGFLLPQILLNIFRGSAEKALCRSFYVGTSAVRLVPHAYNQYSSHNYPKYDLDSTYHYANPAADFYSTAWDFIISCGIISLAAVVFVQQRYSGRSKVL